MFVSVASIIGFVGFILACVELYTDRSFKRTIRILATMAALLNLLTLLVYPLTVFTALAVPDSFLGGSWGALFVSIIFAVVAVVISRDFSR